MEGRILLARNLDLSSGVRCLNMPKVYILTGVTYTYKNKHVWSVIITIVNVL